MPLIQRSALVPFGAEKMYALVNDIDRYPQFLPWCKGTDVHDVEGENIRASIHMKKGVLEKSFTTQNRGLKNKMIEMKLVDGPFKHLEGYWRFEDFDDGSACKVTLDLEFEFSSKMLGLTLGPIFSQICNSLVDAFVTRAKEVYAQ